jgi:hypothetical protein
MIQTSRLKVGLKLISPTRSLSNGRNEGNTTAIQFGLFFLFLEYDAYFALSKSCIQMEKSELHLSTHLEMLILVEKKTYNILTQ